MKTKCYSVRVKDVTILSEKAVKMVAFDGSSAIIPRSQIFGNDYDVQKSDAYWVSAWILEKKELQYSTKKSAWFDSTTGKMLPTYSVKKHTPKTINPVESNEIESLAK